MIELKFTGQSPRDIVNQLREFIAEMGVVSPESAEAAAEAAAAAAAANGGKKASTKGATVKAAKAAKESGKESLLDVEEAATEEPPLTRAAVLAALTAHMDATSEVETAALLKKYGKAAKLSGVDEKHYRAVYDAAVAATPSA